jgi:protein-tyrosine phosphatase
MSVAAAEQPVDAAPCRGRIGRMCWRIGRRWALRFALLMVAANLIIAATSWVVSAAADTPRPAGVEGVDKLFVVDAQVWRGAHPSTEGYASLAAAGVTTVVDLRAEHDASESHAVATRAGLSVVHLPIRDGQVPSAQQVARFAEVVERAEGIVMVHCGAGVGRTGAMVAAYLVGTGQASGGDALVRNLAVGPPSVEQIWYAANAETGETEGAPVAVVAISRVLDAPRRVLSWF